MMAPTLALRFIFIVLSFFMNGHGINGREMKVADSYKDSPVSNAEAYIAGYRTSPKSIQPTYAASYRNRPSHSGNLNQLYITGYKTSGPPKANQPNYIAGYRTRTHDSNAPHIDGYIRIGSHETNQPHVAVDSSKQPVSGVDETNQPYIAGYSSEQRVAGAHETNQPYIASYSSKQHIDGSHETNQPYVASYSSKQQVAGAYETNQPYIASYSSKQRVASAQETNQPYIAGYSSKQGIAGAHETNQPYVVAYSSKQQVSGAHETNQPYVAAYPSEQRVSGADETNQPYVATYSSKHHVSNSHETNQPYVAPYPSNQLVSNAKDATKESSHDDQPYITQYSGIGPKKGPKESSHNDERYITQYSVTGPKTDPKKSSNMDHTDAFKTGFFALDDLYTGNVMTLQFPIQEVSHFLPRKEADSIPFSMSQLPSVLQLFSIPQDSPQANAMRGTIEQCEAEPITGETKTCATSLESMLEFVATIIGSEAKNSILTTSYPTTSNVPLQNYTILKVSEDIHAPKWVACHPLPYPYALYYCHYISTGTKVFKVSLGGENEGNKIEALGICHLDTSDWSPDHILFRQLGFNPGQAPVCHFFPVKHIMWVPQPSKATM